jgi:ferric-dicitrate binding protein FerR (iron transport regulator)
MIILKTNIAKSSTVLTLIVAVFFAALSPSVLQAQSAPRLFGELTIIKNAAAGAGAGNGFVTVDGARAESGRSVSSPAEIVTPPDASARIALAQTGTITLAPNSSANLSFVNGSIAGDLTRGEITIETVPNTTVNIFTKDGGVWTPNRAEKNTVKISVVNGATRISVAEGQVLFNKVYVSAGETFPKSGDNDSAGAAAGSQTGGTSKGFNPLVIAGVGGAIAAAVILALTVSSSGNDSAPVLSATR